MMSFVRRQFDAVIYGFIGPFAIAYIFPHFFMELEEKFICTFLKNSILNILGVIMLNLGGLLAIWCTIVMYKSKKASPSPFSQPKKLITKGPYKIVRHPMMWALHFVIIGQIFVNTSPFIIIWFLIWLRFSVIFVDKYEEPYLISVFGEDYLQYCLKTPRWIPFTGRIKSN
ncbi:methyltransferase family protein [Flavobacterium aciduliphilum]|uniref:Phospholipid methyltransferase n=1 Tax=Flavobacterium aciduliphilum TaxID=1101402 RepID=A0A328YLN8_9FLAO|nr:isoprenylcysteine carboxylmethyltransferase family protein [Flavobacterium aciduliphilum]RAR71517.1 phospholipid methyltransferase [Flavobacterium aciduliphilum]